MKILQCIESMNPTLGGSVESLDQTSRALQQLGAVVDILNLDNPSASWGEGRFRAIHRVGPCKTIYRYTPALSVWLNNNLRNYDAIVVNGIWRYHSVGLWRVATALNVPYYLVPHGMLHPWLNSGFTLKQARKTAIWWLFESRVLRDATAVIYSSQEERRVSGMSYGRYRCREVVLPLGTADPPEVTSDAFFADHPKLAGKRLFTFLGRLQPAKGCDLALRAFARTIAENPDSHLVMAGPDRVGWRASLEALAIDLGISDRVTWTGFLTGDRKWGLLRASELLVFPSHCESVGYSAIEAAACSLPVLISDKVNSYHELLEDNCAIVNEDTVDGTIRSFREWLSMSEVARRKMRANARQCFLTRYESISAAKQMLEFIGHDSFLRRCYPEGKRQQSC
jgi:glycosyltransferase involved in cell wall biosynthesis